MSLLIKGMKMPKHCLECVLYRTNTNELGDYDYCCISSAIPKGYIPADCPLVELPDHGDLVDIDAMLGDFAELRDYDFASREYVVIPAERE